MHRFRRCQSCTDLLWYLKLIQLIKIYFVYPLDQLIELHRGQGMDIWFRDKYQCPSEEEYFDLIKKSKILFKIIQ